jgi:hypothetical protein
MVSFILLVILPRPSFAQTLPSLPESDKDPFVGTWKMNPVKSSPNSRAYDRTIARDRDDRVFASRISGGPHGVSENHYRIRCDGLPHRVQCGMLSCTTSCTYVAANRVNGETASPDGKMGYWTEEVSADGKEMEIYSYKDKARTKRSDEVVVLDRLK